MPRFHLQTACLTFGFSLSLTLALATTAFMKTQSSATAQDQSSAAALRHVVLFKFKPDATEEQIREIVSGFQALPQKIDGITAFEWGANVSPEGLADGFTHCFVVTFKDAKSRDAYLPHQAHKDFVAILLPRLDEVLVVDYFARK